MIPSARAVIDWLKPEEGGRTTLPLGGRYATIARFDGQEGWPDEAWTLVTALSAAPDDERRRSIATVHFLVEEAPHHLLRHGNRFELMEARRVVARGEILEGVAVQPDRPTAAEPAVRPK